MGEQEVETENWRGRCGALIKIGSVSIWDSCGTTREREAINDE
jgi:hypothetical protein